jgi:hypothetical protein
MLDMEDLIINQDEDGRYFIKHKKHDIQMQGDDIDILISIMEDMLEEI